MDVPWSCLSFSLVLRNNWLRVESSRSTSHVPVLAQEVLQGLQPAVGQSIIDGTLGGGGHAALLCDAVGPDGHVLGLDRDSGAVQRTAETLPSPPAICRAASYEQAPEIAAECGLGRVDGILLDLGLSSDQLADADRGFSFSAGGPLDLRFDTTTGVPAWRLLEHTNEKELARIIFEYGEERFSRRIARRIVEQRRERPIRTAAELAEIVRRCVRPSRHQRIDPATRTFQALRIAVNDELSILQRALARLPDLLKPGGRIAVISFHSLEDRIVKHAFRQDARLRVLTKKPVQAGEQELAENSRARSAKLRVAERTEPSKS